MKNELCLPSLVFVLLLLLVYIESGTALRVYRNNEYEVSEIDKRLDIPHPGPSPRRHRHGLRRNGIIVIDEKPEQSFFKRHHVTVPEPPFTIHQHNNNVLNRRVITPGLHGHKDGRGYKNGSEVTVRRAHKIENEDKLTKSDVTPGLSTTGASQHENSGHRYHQPIGLKRVKVTHEEKAGHELEFESDVKSLGSLVDKAEREIQYTRSHNADITGKYPHEMNHKGIEGPLLHRGSQHMGVRRQEIIHALNEENSKVEPEDDIESLGRRMDESGNEIKDSKYEQATVGDKHAVAATRYIISKIQEIQDKLFKRTGNKELEDKLNQMATGPTKKDKSVVALSKTPNKTLHTSKTNLTKPMKTAMENQSTTKEKDNDTKSIAQPAERRKIIPEEVVDKILEKFQQLKKEAKHIAVSASRHSVEHAVEDAFPVEHTDGTEWKKDVTSSIQHSSSPSKCIYSHKNVNDTPGQKRTISILNDGRAILNQKSGIADYGVSPSLSYEQQDATHDETFSSQTFSNLQNGLDANPYAEFSIRAGVALPELPPILDMYNQHQKSILGKNEGSQKHSQMQHNDLFNIGSSADQDMPLDTYNPAFFNNQEEKRLLDTMSETGTKPPISSMQVNGYDRQPDLANSRTQIFETGVTYAGQAPILFKNKKYMDNDRDIAIKRERFPLINVSSNQRHVQKQRNVRSINIRSLNNRNSFGISLPELLNLENEAQLFSNEVSLDDSPPSQTNLFSRGMDTYPSNYHGTPIPWNTPLRNFNNLNHPQRSVLPNAHPSSNDQTNEGIGIQVADIVNEPLESINIPSSETSHQNPTMRSTIQHNNDVSPIVINDKAQQRSAVVAANMIANALQTELGISHPFVLATNDPYKYVEKTLTQSMARRNNQIQLTNSNSQNNNKKTNINIVPGSLMKMKAELYSSIFGHNRDNDIKKASDVLVPDRVMNYENDIGKTPQELQQILNLKFASERLK